MQNLPHEYGDEDDDDSCFVLNTLYTFKWHVGTYMQI